MCTTNCKGRNVYCKCFNVELVKFKNTQAICLICGEELTLCGNYTVGLGEISKEKLKKARLLARQSHHTFNPVIEKYINPNGEK